MRERSGVVVTRFAFGALTVALGLAAAFLLWLDSTHLEAEYLGVMGFKLGRRPAGITLAVLAAFAALAAVAFGGLHPEKVAEKQRRKRAPQKERHQQGRVT